MRKTIYLFIAVLLQCAVFGQKQTITSIANGNWLTPTTWDCSCVPTTGNDVVINHDVILNTDLLYTSGTITINSGASLTKDASMRSIALYGGAIVNNSAFEVDRLAVNSGSVTNSNTMIVYQAYYNAATLTNDGFVEQVDSLMNSGTIYNNSNGRIETVHLWNNSQIISDGYLDMTYFWNTGTYDGAAGITHTSHFLNSGSAATGDSVLVDVDFMNTGMLHNLSNNPFLVTHDFLNCDSTYHDALFINDGFVHIGNNFTNADTLRGNDGSFCIAAYSTNIGYIKGSVDICDLTPMSGPPYYIDVNTGTIETNVTSCTHSCGVGIIEEDNYSENVEVYPNPFSNSTTFTFHAASPSGASLSVYDMTGNEISKKSFGNAGTISISNELPSGIYFYMIKNKEGKTYSGKLFSL